MSKPHNKKRNVGIIYEQLINYISQAIVEGKEDRAARGKKVLLSNFKSGTQLYKEFRLFNALVKTTVKSDSLASRILEEAKKAAQDHDEIKLRSEKSKLIREINHQLNDRGFYSRNVPDYRTYATIQTLLNDWRKPSKDISRAVMYESKIHEWLMSEKNTEEIEKQKTSDVNKLTVKLMTEKFNSKYTTELLPGQKKIVQDYVFSITQDNDDKIKTSLTSIKKRCTREMKEFSRQCNNSILNEKIDKVQVLLEGLDPQVVSDETISRFLLVDRLVSELEEKESV